MSSRSNVSRELLDVPARVVSVHGATAWVVFWRVRVKVRLDLLDEPIEPGDAVFTQAGYATQRVASEDASAAFALYEDLLRTEGLADSMDAEASERLTGPTVIRTAHDV